MHRIEGNFSSTLTKLLEKKDMYKVSSRTNFLLLVNTLQNSYSILSDQKVSHRKIKIKIS